MDILGIKNSSPNRDLMQHRMKRLSEDIGKVDRHSTDEELMKACKSFEAYMFEQVLIKMDEMAHIDDKEKDNEYLSMFKEHFMKDMAVKITEHTDLGIAKMLYESMKRNVLTNQKPVA